MSEQEIVDVINSTNDDEPAARFYGRMHSDEYGKLTERHKRLYHRLIRVDYWQDFGDGCGEGTLANKLGLRLTDDAWIVAIRRLSNPPFSLIELLPASHDGKRRIKLTKAGRSLAQELTGDRQREGLDREGE